MVPKFYSAIFFASLLGTTLCVIPEGEIQIGPIFGKGSRFFGGGHKHFEAVFEKGGDLKPLLAKKAIIGAGVLGAGALAAGGAALLAKKGHISLPHLNFGGWGWGGNKGGYAYGQQGYGHGHSQGYYDSKYNSVPVSPSYGTPSSSSGWGSQQQAVGGYYDSLAVAAPHTDNVKFPASSYPSSQSSSYGTSAYPSTDYGYPESEWQGSSGGYGGSFGVSGWSR